MPWRLAKSLEVLRAQVNHHWPNRDKSSDGSIGDAAHASRSSDHNPWVKEGRTGIVTAIDITHDPKNGPDAGELAEALRVSQDKRIKYIISNRRIASADKGFKWRKYTGSNPHDKHVHISVQANKAAYDSTLNWGIGAPPVRFAETPDHHGSESAPWYRRWWKSLVTGLGLSGVTIGGVTLNAETIYAIALLFAVVVIIGGTAFLVYWKFVRGE